MARGGFIERTLAGLTDALDRDNAPSPTGPLRGLDPRVKVLGIFGLVLAAVVVRPVGDVLGLFGVAVALAVAGAGAGWRTLATRAWLPVLTFTGPLALPAIFLTPGPPLLPGWPMTAPGTWAALRLLARAETTATLLLALAVLTPWPHVLRALRVLGVPAVFVVVLGMTLRYGFLLLEGARELFEARRSRLVGPLPGRERARLAGATAGVLLGRSLGLGEEVFGAMRSRGFRGEVVLLDDFAMRGRDWWALGGFGLVVGMFVWTGAT